MSPVISAIYADYPAGVSPEPRFYLGRVLGEEILNFRGDRTLSGMLKDKLHRIAWSAEKATDRYKSRRTDRRIIEPYLGYATPEHLVVRGRVLTALRRNKPKPDQSRWTNFKQMFALFLTSEVSNVEVRARDVDARSNEEGYFTILLPRDGQQGWVDVEVHLPNAEVSTICPVMVASQAATFAVISDIDDTVLQTGAYSLVRNLWTSLTGNVNTRQVFPDAVTFMRAMSEGGRNPIYYVSSSPWNLHHFLKTIFAKANLVSGPKFLRDLGLSKTKFITGSHGDHKGSSIDTLLAANPGLRYVLVGDTGQHDAFVYRDAIQRHPGRIAAVVLREPGPGPDAESQAAMAEIEAAGVALFHGTQFDDFIGPLKSTLGVTRSG